MKPRDDSGSLSRRTVLAGISGLALAGPVCAETVSPIARDMLANNLLALAFEKPPTTRLPNLSVVGLDGQKQLSELSKGRTVLMPIWAEWCAPCLGEIPDFARLQQKYGNDKFAIIPVLSAPKKQVTPPVIKQLLTSLHAEIFEPYIEVKFGSKFAKLMASLDAGFGLPCNILIGPDGRVVARVIGLKRDKDDQTQSAASSAELIKRAEAGDNLSLWGKPAGEEFARAMADGFLRQP